MPNAKPGRPQAASSAGTPATSTEDGNSQSQVSEFASRMTDTCLESVREHPTASALVAFGVGLGVGAVLGASMATPPRHSRIEIANRLGRRLLDSLQEALPDAITPNWR